MEVYDTELLKIGSRIYDGIITYYDIIMSNVNRLYYVVLDVSNSEYVVYVDLHLNLEVFNRSMVESKTVYSHYAFDPLMMLLAEPKGFDSELSRYDKRLEDKYMKAVKIIKKMFRKDKDKMLRLMKDIGLLKIEVDYYGHVKMMFRPKEVPKGEELKIDVAKYYDGRPSMYMYYYWLCYSDEEVKEILAKAGELSEIIGDVTKRAYVIFKMFNLI